MSDVVHEVDQTRIIFNIELVAELLDLVDMDRIGSEERAILNNAQALLRNARERGLRMFLGMTDHAYGVLTMHGQPDEH